MLKRSQPYNLVNFWGFVLLKARSKLFNVFLRDQNSFKFAIGVLLGLSFSIGVILSTVGLMDGFESVMKRALKNSVGDFSLTSRNGFFSFDKDVSGYLKSLDVEEATSFIQTEGFVIFSDLSQGVQVKGVEPIEFSRVTGLGLNIEESQVAIGIQLSKKFGIKKGDRIVLAFATGNESLSERPLLKGFFVGQILTHGLYQKDERIIYIKRKTLDSILELNGMVNVVSGNLPIANSQGDGSKNKKKAVVTNQSIFSFLEKARGVIPKTFYMLPYWDEYAPLLEAVKHDKLIISVILQLVVIISIFNMVAFIFYVNEKKSREIFLFRALGMSEKELFKTWLFVVLFFWFFSCLLSLFVLQVFDWSLANLAFLKLPGDVYNLERIHLALELEDYAIVFLTSLFWFAFFSWIALFRMKRKSILEGLRKEFS